MNDGREWTEQVTASNFGQSQVGTGVSIRLVLYLNNPWTAYGFGQLNISAVQVNALEQQVARGVIMLNSIYPNSSAFTPVTLQNVSLS